MCVHPFDSRDGGTPKKFGLETWAFHNIGTSAAVIMHLAASAGAAGLGELHANEDRGEPYTHIYICIYIYTRGATSVINFQTLPTS